MNTIISLGGGVQSTILALSVTKKYYTKELADQLPNPIVIMSDTGSEKPETMEYVKNIIMPELDKNNIENYIVKSKLGNLHDYYLEKHIIPFRRYRQCTDKWKITPINKKVRELGYDKNNPISMALGITTDEAQRMKPNHKKWIKNIFPLIEANYSRQDCYEWFRKHDLNIPVKSGCFCCPFSPKKEWLQMYKTHPELIEIAVKMENNASQYRNKTLSLYRDNMTLEQLIESEERKIPFAFFEDYSTDDECSGTCFT